MHSVKKIAGLAGLVLVLGAPAGADNTICTGAIYLVPDGSMHVGTFTAPNQDRWFRFVAKANRSYALVSENLSPTDVQAGVGMFAPIGPDCMGSMLFTTGSNMTEPVTIDPLNSYGSVRRTMMVAADTEVFFRIDGSADFRVRVEETTQFSPAWTTNGTFDTFYSLQNTTNAVISGTLTLSSIAGAVIDTEAVVIPAGGTFSANTSSMGTTRGQSGVATLVHNGPPGAVLCEVAIANFTISPPYIQAVKCQTARQQR